MRLRLSTHSAHRSRATLIVAVLALASSLASLGSRPARAQSIEINRGPTIEKIAAVVNSEIVLLSEVKEKAAQVGQANPDDKLLRQVLDRMVDDTLILQQATDLKLTVEAAEIDRAVDEVRKQNNLEGGAFEQALTDQGYSVATYRKDLRKQILRIKVINTAVRSNINISDDDVKAFYEQSARQSGGKRQAHVRHVLVGVPAGAPSGVIEQKRKLATRVLEEARAGGDLNALARTYSDDAATKEEGGDLGWVKEGDGLSEGLEAVIFQMEQPNEVRGPVRTDKGFEVVQLVEKKDLDVKPLAEVKDQIRQQLYSAQLEKHTQSWIAELRKKAHIETKL